MRTHGTLVKWNEDRGFGFINAAQGGEVFVHIYAFPRDGIRPLVNELISFEIELDENGKKRAVRVARPSGRNAPSRTQYRTANKPAKSRFIKVVGLLVTAVIVAYSYSAVMSKYSAAPAQNEPVLGEEVVSVPEPSFQCDGRTHCSQMKSCEEAEYFLTHCPNVQMDGNNDGEPCERQWCNH